MEKRKGYLWWMTFEVWMSEDIAMREIRDIEALKSKFA
jgi:hypothetical protein